MDSTALFSAARHYLAHLRAAQDDLLELLNAKKDLLLTQPSSEWNRLVTQEQELLRRLQGLVRLRQRVLETAQGVGQPARSIAELLQVLSPADWPVLSLEVQAVRATGQRIQHESWSQWIVAHRGFRHYSELRELIAHRGEAPPDYQLRGSSSSGTGGALLDTAV